MNQVVLAADNSVQYHTDTKHISTYRVTALRRTSEAAQRVE